jgi:hypothetical protein
MNRDKKTKDDFDDRKDYRRKNIKNKSLDKRNGFDDESYVPKVRKEIKKRMEDMKADEIWEDWENYYNS